MKPVRRSGKSIWACWNRVSSRLRGAKQVLLVLDFDGTLAPLCAWPGKVRLPSRTRAVLQRLTRHPRVRLCFISGRRWKDLHDRVGLKGVQYLGLYGGERRPAGVRLNEAKKLAQQARRSVEKRLNGLHGVWIENKGLGFALHDRDASSGNRKHAENLLHEALQPFRRHLRVIENQRGLEVLPRALEDKGAAMRALLGENYRRDLLPIYLGDDLSDESAFAALRRGFTVRVGPRARTRARYTLRDPEDARDFLERLEAELT